MKYEYSPLYMKKANKRNCIINALISSKCIKFDALYEQYLTSHLKNKILLILVFILDIFKDNLYKVCKTSSLFSH